MQYGVIIAGGRGIRLWPMSREARPKQLLEIVGGRSLLELAYDRLATVLPPERIVVCTAERDASEVQRQLSKLPPENILGEPVGRDTVNAIGLCCAVLRARDPEAVLAFVTADHVIEPVPVFAAALTRAFHLADRPNRLVTFGIVPTFPHTGLGYVEQGAALVDDQSGAADAFTVTAFVEKPDLEHATEYVNSGRFLWNSGMFVWRASTLLDQLAQRLPATHDALARVAATWSSAERAAALADVYPTLPATSIDYAVMEPASTDPAVEVVVVPLELDWLDVGSWPSLAGVLPTDADGNTVQAPAVLVDSAGNIVISDLPDRLTAAIGLRDTVVVHTADVTLICPIADAPRLKDLVAAVAERTGTRFL
jgi:mannose-1-phosphate guanylyltransferase